MTDDRPRGPLFPGLRPPAPPPELRRKVLRTAAEALAAEPTRDIWTRVWESRPLRLAWAASVLILLAGHLLVSAHAPWRGAARSHPSAETSREAGRELATVVTLPPIDETAEPLAGTGSHDAEPAHRAAPAKAKEKKS